MLIPKKHRSIVYKNLFDEGVICAPDKPNLPKHPEIDVPNLHVMMLMKSMASRGLVSARFSWRWHYWSLTNEGLAYLREYLGGLPEHVLPKTHMKAPSRPQTGRPFGDRDAGRGDRPFGGRGGFEGGRGRDGYRSGPPREGGRGFGKDGGAPGGDVRPAFVGGRGAGRGAAPRS